MKCLFLDIDGVLNGHQWNEDAKSNPIIPECVGHFNRIIRETGAQIVLSSAWRYMILGGAMTILGFEYMLRTHGCLGKIVGHTPSDEEIKERADQIKHWLDNHPEVESYVVLDDMHLGLRERFVRTDERIGLTAETASEAIRILNS